MRDPERWLSSPDAPDGMRDLLSAAQDVAPSAAQKAALAGKLGISASAVWLAPAVKALIVGAAVAGGVVAVNQATGGEARATQYEQVVSAARPSPAPPVQDAVAEEPDAVQDALDSAALEVADEQESLEKSSEKSASANKRAVTAKPAEPELPSEASLLTRARSQLDQSPRAALSLLNQHRELYPQGVLAQEREVLHMRALKAAGMKDAAEAEAEKFRKEHPDSVHHVP